MPAKPRVFFDLDGVMADFNKGACLVFGIDYPVRAALGYGWSYRQIVPEISVPAYLDRLAEAPDFWADLEIFTHAKSLTLMAERAGLEWYFLSATTSHPKCWSGKCKWVTNHFGKPGLRRLILLSSKAKCLLARSGDILVDDSQENCDDWNAHGGVAVPWAEYTPGHAMTAIQLDHFQMRLTAASKNFSTNEC